MFLNKNTLVTTTKNLKHNSNLKHIKSTRS